MGTAKINQDDIINYTKDGVTVIRNLLTLHAGTGSGALRRATELSDTVIF